MWGLPADIWVIFTPLVPDEVGILKSFSGPLISSLFAVHRMTRRGHASGCLLFFVLSLYVKVKSRAHIHREALLEFPQIWYRLSLKDELMTEFCDERSRSLSLAERNVSRRSS